MMISEIIINTRIMKLTCAARGQIIFPRPETEVYICAKNQAQRLLHYMNIIDRDDVDVLDAFGFEVIISIDITRDLGTASPCERSRNADLRVMSKLKDVSICVISGIQ